MAARRRLRRGKRSRRAVPAACRPPASCPDASPVRPSGPPVLIFRRPLQGGHSDHSKFIPDVQSVRHVFPHDCARTARDHVARGDLRAAHARPVHDHAGVLGLRENHPGRRQRAARRHRARGLRRHAVAVLHFLRLGVRQVRPQAGDRRGPRDLRARQLRRRVRARHHVDHRRPRDPGDGRRIVRGARVHRRPDFRAEPYQGDGDGRRLDRRVVRGRDRRRADRVPLGRDERAVHDRRRTVDPRDRRRGVDRARCGEARARARAVRRGAAQRRAAAPELRRAGAACDADGAVPRRAAPARRRRAAGRRALEGLPAGDGARVRDDGPGDHRRGETGQDEAGAARRHSGYPDRPIAAGQRAAYHSDCGGDPVRLLPRVQHPGSVAAFARVEARAGFAQGRGHGRLQHHAVDRARARRHRGRLAAEARRREHRVLRVFWARCRVAYNRGQHESAAAQGLNLIFGQAPAAFAGLPGGPLRRMRGRPGIEFTGETHGIRQQGHPRRQSRRRS
ncbi:LigA [Burkholderia sp. IT-111MI5]